MKIQITRNAMCGETEIPAGEYWVSLHSDQGKIFLSQGGKDIKLNAVRRRRAGKGKTTVVTFYSGGGGNWSLLICSPQYGEWISQIEYRSRHDKD